LSKTPQKEVQNEVLASHNPIPVGTTEMRLEQIDPEQIEMSFKQSWAKTKKPNFWVFGYGFLGMGF
jgi:hypothetical protein